MYVAFLTGSIASGKSYVGERLNSEYGIARIDLDSISRDVLRDDVDCIKAVQDAFGSDVVDLDGAINRRKLAQKAFASDESIALLEELELPYIKQRMRQALCDMSKSGCEVCFVEVPVLDRFEDCFEVADEIICVLADRELRLRRAVEQRGMDESDFVARDSKQPSSEYLLECADYSIQNNESIEKLNAQIDALAKHLKQCAC